MTRTLATLLLLALAAPAAATPEESRALILEMLGKPGDTGLSWDEPEARAAANGDFVRVPNMKLTMPKGTIRFGAVDFIVSPATEPTRRKIAVQLPQSMKLLDENDEPSGEVRLGENRFEGIYDRDYARFVDYSGVFREIAYSAVD